MKEYTIKLPLPTRKVYGSPMISMRKPILEDIRLFLSGGDSSVVSKNRLINSLVDQDIMRLPKGVRDYIYLYVRQFVAENDYSATFVCSACTQPNTIVMSHVDYEISQLPEDFLEFTEVGTEYGTITLHIETAADEEKIEEVLEYYRTSDVELPHSDLGEDLATFVRYALMLGDESKLSENLALIRKLDMHDFSKIVMYDTLFQVGPVTKKLCKCSNCDVSWRINIPLEKDYLGIKLEDLLTQYRFLAKKENIGYQDFLRMTSEESRENVYKEIELKN